MRYVVCWCPRSYRQSFSDFFGIGQLHLWLLEIALGGQFMIHRLLNSTSHWRQLSQSYPYLPLLYSFSSQLLIRGAEVLSFKHVIIWPYGTPQTDRLSPTADKRWARATVRQWNYFCMSAKFLGIQLQQEQIIDEFVFLLYPKHHFLFLNPLDVVWEILVLRAEFEQGRRFLKLYIEQHIMGLPWAMVSSLFGEGV